MKLDRAKIALIFSTISVITMYSGMLEVNAVWPFDEFMSPETKNTTNSSQDPFSDLPGEHGESADED